MYMLSLSKRTSQYGAYEKESKVKNLSKGLSSSPGYNWAGLVGRYNPKLLITYIDENSH